MDESELASEMRIAFTDLLRMLDDERETRWCGYVKGALAELAPPFVDDAELHSCLVGAVSMWHTIYAGNGSFSDWFVWREDLAERSAANNPFDEVVSRIQNLTGKFQR